MRNIKALLLISLLSCGESAGDKRAKLAKKGKGDIKIGVTKGVDEGLLLQGIELALEEVYDSGTLGGRKIVLDIQESDDQINQGLMNAEKLAEDISTIAVISDEKSYITLPASSIYEFNKLLMLSTRSTASEITSNDYDYIFRTIPSDRELSSEMFEYFVQKKHDKTMICYTSGLHGISMANSFEKEADFRGYDIVDRMSFDIGDQREFGRIISRWTHYNFNSILFIGAMPEVGSFLEVLQQYNIKVPVVCSDDAATPSFLEVRRELTEGIALPAVFHPDDVSEEDREFVRAFSKKYNTEPDQSAALGYDALKLIVAAIKKGRSTVPADLVKELRKMKDQRGVTNVYNFDDHGDLVLNGRIGMQSVVNQKFKFMGHF